MPYRLRGAIHFSSERRGGVIMTWIPRPGHFVAALILLLLLVLVCPPGFAGLGLDRRSARESVPSRLQQESQGEAEGGRVAVVEEDLGQHLARHGCVLP
jgi:hypothetical protein